MKNKFVCIHGHFYQPPRENPWIEEVETEDSAFPYHDWNERILHECYGPNLASPILAKENEIAELVNNYEHISFNIGPTLLSWLERRHPSVYAEILLADGRSVQRRGGHGNAIAQVYNHVIMPLAGRRDKTTQVRWGAHDFKYRFRRDPEGIWLAETAVDEETLEVLIQEGLKFTILSPAQAAKVRPFFTKEWKPVAADTLDTSVPYRWYSKESEGKFIDLFFYHGKLSHGVAFERLLNSGEDFAKRIFSAFAADESTQLVSLATDGETFGHHHRFGNMGLSYALRHLPKETPARLTNYGEFLSNFPPKNEVEIRPKTAWSCSHGVGRWMDDCGCNTGAHPGWHQKWRKPLREALDWLAGEIDALYVRRTAKLLTDPWACRDAYVARLLEPTAQTTHQFLRQAALDHLGPEEARETLRLCEMQRNRLLMFTSCGWFFDDPSGIETRQILKYAARAIELADGAAREYMREGTRAVPPGTEKDAAGRHARGAAGKEHSSSRGAAREYARGAAGKEHSSSRGDSARLEKEFVERLAKCPSNDPEQGDAGKVYLKSVAPLRVTMDRAAAHFAIAEHLQVNPRLPSAISLQKTTANNIFGATAQGNYEIKRRHMERFTREDAQRENHCSVIQFETRELPTLERQSFVAAVFQRDLAGVECWISPGGRQAEFERSRDALRPAFESGDAQKLSRTLSEHFSPNHFGVDALFSDYRRAALRYLIPHGSRESQDALRAWRVEVRRLQLNPAENPEHLLALILENKRAGADPDALPHIEALRDRVTYAFKALCVRPTPKGLQEALDLLSAAMQIGLRIDPWELKWLYSQFAAKAGRQYGSELQSAEANRALARLLHFPVPEAGAAASK